jgi:hypothetical protein
MPDGLSRAWRGLLSRRIVVFVILAAILPIACTAPIPDRPREGAPVGTPVRPDENSAPPTLSPFSPGNSGSLTTPGQGPPSPPLGSTTGSPSPAASPSPLATGGYVIVATDGAGANMRTGPSTSSPVITTVAEGTAVEVIGDPVTSEGRAWRQIRSGGHDGWVVDVVVRQGSPFAAPAPPAPRPAAPMLATPRPAAPTTAAPKPAAPTTRPSVGPTARPR